MRRGLAVLAIPSTPRASLARAHHLDPSPGDLNVPEAAGQEFVGYRALITAGGIGTRLLPFSKETPKEMFPIITFDENDSMQLKPLVQAIYEQLYGVGFRSFFIVVGRGKRSIEDHFTPDPGFLELLKKKGNGVKSLREFYDKIQASSLVFLNQPEPMGFGDAVLRGREFIEGPFLVQAADTFIISRGEGYLHRMLQAHTKYGANATLLLQEVDDPSQYGVVEGESMGNDALRLTYAEEKPAAPKSNLAIMPVYLFDKGIFDALSATPPGRGGELQLTDAIMKLINNGQKIMGVKLHKDELRLDIGTPDTMLEALKLSSKYVENKRRWAKKWETDPGVKMMQKLLQRGRQRS
jgi:UTP--glucose-1-phosphate uridylyltransferase